MKERVCCVYDTDERYAVKLTEAMNRSDKVPYKVMAFSSEEALLDCNRNCEIEMLLTGENIDAQEISEIRSAIYIHWEKAPMTPATILLTNISQQSG